MRPGTALALAVGLGLVGGYLDVALIVFKRDVAHASAYYEQGRDFRWLVPLVSVGVLLVPGVALALLSVLRRGLVSRQGAAWVCATLALWGPLLRAPLAGPASLVLAAGLGRWASRGALRLGRSPGRARATLAVLALLPPLTAAVTVGTRARSEARAALGRPSAPAGARNVLLIVLDTVRAESTTLGGSPRDTTPNLARWAQRGLTFDRAIAAAPWTLPSHGTLFTGVWPSRLNLHWEPALDTAVPTLAGCLAGQGYRTGGFAANTNNCSYETGLARGFDHYEDYPLTPLAALGSTVPGRWLAGLWLDGRDDFAAKWLAYQSRGAPEVNRAFLDWLGPSGTRQAERPFFAFLNYLDAHEPFVLPRGETAHFGLKPVSRADSRFLMDYWHRDKRGLTSREITLARDAYDDTIAYLDRQVGALLDELDRRGVLGQTLVIVTSDHGEEFGERGVFNHGYSLYQAEVRVPLLLIAPGLAPEGKVVTEPVSLRDVPATVAGLLKLGGASPFPGGSLEPLWREGVNSGPRSPAYSEVNVPLTLPPSRGVGPTLRGFSVSLVSAGRHYTRDSLGAEALFDLAADSAETHDRKNSTQGMAALRPFRAEALRLLDAPPAPSGVALGYLGQFMARLRAVSGPP